MFQEEKADKFYKLEFILEEKQLYIVMMTLCLVCVHKNNESVGLFHIVY